MKDKKYKDFRIDKKINCLIIIIIQLMEGRTITTREISKLVNKDIRTCQRYILLLKDIGLPIKSKRGVHHYENKNGITPFYLSKEKIYMIYLALISFSSFGEDEEVKNNIIGDIELMVAPFDRKILVEVKENIIMKNRSILLTENKSIYKLFMELIKCFHSRNKIKLRYKSKIKESTFESINIYGFCLAKESYYMLVSNSYYDNSVNKNNKFLLRLDRIISFEILDETYKIEKNFSIDEYFKYAFEVECGIEIFYFKLEFYNEGIFNAKERIWFEEQKVYSCADKVIFEGRTSSKKELKKWILGYGSNVKVIEPIWLKEEIIKEIKKSINLYT